MPNYFKRPKRKIIRRKKKIIKRKIATKVKRNTSRINKLIKSTLVRTYWQHNDNDRVNTLYPNVDEPHYRSFTPLIPNNMELLFNKMTEYTEQQKIYIRNCKVTVSITLGNAAQAQQPIDYSIFCVKIKPRMRAQFYDQNYVDPHNLRLIENIHYTGNFPSFQAPITLPATFEQNKANIRLNPDIFDIHYYKHGYLSTNVKNQTATGSGDDNVTSLQVRRCNFNIPYKATLKSDTWTEDPSGGGAPQSNRHWTDMTYKEVPLFNRYHIIIFTSANYQLIPNTTPGNNLIQSNIQCLFNATSAN